MHDPLTVAHEIRYPWRKYKNPRNDFEKTYRESIITIWHKDPERNGSDDSCGWFTPPLSKEIREICKNLAWSEARDPLFMALDAKNNSDPIQCERLIFGAFMIVSQSLVNRGAIRRRVSVRDAQRWAAEAAYNTIDNFSGTLCFKSGYHSNWYKDGIPNSVEDDRFFRERQATSFFLSIAGWILRERRWWFQKPRWHVWHWKFQIHAIQAFKRWAFSRCAGCRKRFEWGYSPVTTAWSGGGPRWFKSEDHTYHSECCPTGGD